MRTATARATPIAVIQAPADRAESFVTTGNRADASHLIVLTDEMIVTTTENRGQLEDVRIVLLIFCFVARVEGGHRPICLGRRVCDDKHAVGSGLWTRIAMEDTVQALPIVSRPSKTLGHRMHLRHFAR